MHKKIKRVVIKVGSQLLSKGEGLDEEFLGSLSEQVSKLIEMQKQVVIVSSGAVLAGIKVLGLNRKPFSLMEKQALSAIGQPYLMSFYQRFFDGFNLRLAQVLLTAADLRSKERFFNTVNTFNALMKFNVIPIVNENDTVSVDEIKVGDNDNLSAHVSVAFDADLLIILTVTNGIYDKDPNRFDDARHIPVVRDVDALRDICDFHGKTCFGTGGMWTKVSAAVKAMNIGIPVVVANGRKENVVLDAVSGKPIGTLFLPSKKVKLKAYRIFYLMEPKAKLFIDKGAANAIIDAGKSLLPQGIKRIEGDFRKGDAVLVCDLNGKPIAKGIVRCNKQDLSSFRSECIHRNEMVRFP